MNETNASDISNDTTNSQNDVVDYGLPFVISMTAFLVVVIVLAIVGNSMVILTVFRHKRMRTRTNMFIVNLAISDILAAVLDMPLSLVTLINGKWIFGDAMCQFNGFTIVLFLITSIHTLMYISIHKCISITRPFSRFMTKRRILYMIICSWLWAFIYALGAVLGWNKSVYKFGATQCGPSIPNSPIKYSHSLVNTVFNFLLPLIILSICYYRTFSEIRRHMKRMLQTSNMDNQNTVIQQKRIAVTLFMVMACFMICFSPYIGYSCTAAFWKKKNQIPPILNPVAYWCVYSNCACNPIIYAFRSPAFRQGYKEIMCGKAMHYLSAGSFRSGSQRSWSFRNSVKSAQAFKDKIVPENVHVIKNGLAIEMTENSNKDFPPRIDRLEEVEIDTDDKTEILRSTDQTNGEAATVCDLHPDSKAVEEVALEDDKEKGDAFYDSDVEVEHESQRRERRLRRRRESKSLFVCNKDYGMTVSHLVNAQAKLMSINPMASMIRRPHSLSDLLDERPKDLPMVLEARSAIDLVQKSPKISEKKKTVHQLEKSNKKPSGSRSTNDMTESIGQTVSLTHRLNTSLGLSPRMSHRHLEQHNMFIFESNDNISSI